MTCSGYVDICSLLLWRELRYIYEQSFFGCPKSIEEEWESPLAFSQPSWWWSRSNEEWDTGKQATESTIMRNENSFLAGSFPLSHLAAFATRHSLNNIISHSWLLAFGYCSRSGNAHILNSKLKDPRTISIVKIESHFQT